MYPKDLYSHNRSLGGGTCYKQLVHVRALTSERDRDGTGQGQRRG